MSRNQAVSIVELAPARSTHADRGSESWGRLTVPGRGGPESDALLTEDAAKLVASLHREFEGRRARLLQERARYRGEIQSGVPIDFRPDTLRIREAEWTTVDLSGPLTARRVEVVGPVDRESVVHALVTPADVFVADFEDAHSPVWHATIRGHLNLVAAVRRRVGRRNPDPTHSRAGQRPATLALRPRALDVDEVNVQLGGVGVAAGFFDLALHAAHTARDALALDQPLVVNLPKLEHQGEANLWRDVLGYAERRLDLPRNSMKVSVSIETAPAAFEIDEILFELRHRAIGLSFATRNYVASLIRLFRNDRRFVVPDRAKLTMAAPFLDAASDLFLRTCRRRGVAALFAGGPGLRARGSRPAEDHAASVSDPFAWAMEEGYDGLTVFDLRDVAAARDCVTGRLAPHTEITQRWGDVHRTDLLRPSAESVSVDGIRSNARLVLRYLDAWLRGVGVVFVDGVRADAGTCELCRDQLWQWVQWRVSLDDGTVATPQLVRLVFDDECSTLLAENPLDVARRATLDRAVRLADELVTDREFPESFQERCLAGPSARRLPSPEKLHA